MNNISSNFPVNSKLFVFDEEEHGTKLKDIPIGQKFCLNGKIYKKTSNDGWYIGICNVVDEQGQIGHIDPRRAVQFLN